jgi:serine O-acetyltransferase
VTVVTHKGSVTSNVRARAGTSHWNRQGRVSMFENVRADLRAATKWNTGRLLGEFLNPGTQAVLVYRFGHWCCNVRVPLLRQILLIIQLFLSYFVRAFMGVSIDPRARIGPGFLIHSSGGIYIPPIKIGRDFTVQHGAHINWHCIEIGDQVVLGPGCKIGADLRIGDRVRIGPNAVVTSSVPDDTTVVALPPRMLKIRLRERSRVPAEARKP